MIEGMNVLEKEIEDMIWQGLKENRRLLQKKGLWVWDNATYHRQVDLGSYGICDILGLRVQPKKDGVRYVNAQVIEIKKEEINSTTFYQALRYAKGVTRFIETNLSNTSCICSITLIGKTVDNKSDFVYLPDIFSSIALYTYSIDFQKGILFTREADYYARNEAIPLSNDLKSTVICFLSEQIKGKKEEELPF
jgi:hypothetical protein